MVARISTAQIYSTALKGMMDVQRNVSRTQEQIASNKRVLTPGDDPIAATRILQLNQELAQLDQYNNSLNAASARLQREEAALTGISNQILKAQELIAQSGNAGLNAEQRKYIAVELQSIVDSMAQTMNSQDANGEYIFAGYQGKNQPFVKGPDGNYQYQGDEGQRTMQLGPTTTLAINDSGKKVFMDIPSTSTSLSASAGAGNKANPPAAVSDVRVQNQAALDAFYPESVVIEFRPMDEVNPPALNYTVKQVSDGRVLSRNAAYTPGGEIRFAGASVRISGSPAPGDSFKVETSNRKGLLQGLEDYIHSLNTLSDSAADKALLAEHRGSTLGNLDNAQVRLLETRSAVGARLNIVDAGIDNNADHELLIRATLSELADLDYAEAISRLTQESFVLEAAQSSFARISRLSLFNFL